MEFKFDLHTHTIASGHAFASVTEMAKAGAEKGLELMGITEHGPGIPGTCDELYFSNMKEIPRTMFGMEMMFGSELNILDYDGTISMDAERIDRCLDIRIAGIHIMCYDIGTMAENTKATVKAIENPQIDIISHPDDSRMPVDYETIVDAAKENHTLLEVNNSSLDSLTSRVNAWDNLKVMLDFCAKKSVPVVANTDSHFTHRVGVFDHVQKLFDEIDFPEELVVNRSVDVLKDIISKHRTIRQIGKA